jgi:hypothetical protein
VARQKFSHPAIHMVPSYDSQDMQITSTTGTHPLAMLSPSVDHFHDDSYVAYPQPYHFLPIDICTQVGGYPLAPLGRTNTSLNSLAATSQLGHSRLSIVDKGKGPMIFAPSASPPFPSQTYHTPAQLL